ncbi:restriction endonuclease subunit S [Pusillimonas sp. T2]|uniref:restriction endonuclease subunit S n=1 Tax=Pusillimonas sp. T2 TaxID=1548123 RepID=UPI000B9466AB|nr:restriction endonuclease subunit S [Pusillimonas sp. T2]OXR48098.1 restriction endonuclease subunit S [Pusillimonas sp. T2]
MSEVIPEGWRLLEAEEIYSRMRVQKVYDRHQVHQDGKFPVIDQSESGCIGFINNDPDFLCTPSSPLTTFANHTCFVRQMRKSFSVIQNVFPLKAKKDVSQEFLFHMLNGSIKQDGYKGHYPALRETQFLLPPLPEQQKIATILSSVDDVIEKTRAQIDKLKDLKTGMMQELLTQGIGHTEFKDSPVGRIPASWSECILQDIAVVQTGVAKNGKLTGDFIEVPYLRVANVQDGYLDLTEIKTISIEASRLDRFLLRDEDVLVNEGGDFDKLGRGFIWRNQVSPCVHQNHVFVVRTNKAKLLPLFFNYLSGSEYGKKYYLGCAKQTTNLASLNSTQLKAFPILLPSIQEQKGICDVLQSFDEKLQQVKAKLESLLILKKALMQDLLTGKVRVKFDSREVAAA